MEYKKNPQSDMDKLPWRIGFFGIGGVFALAVVALMFGWTQFEDIDQEGLVNTNNLLEDEEIIQVAVVPPPPPPPPPPPQTTVIEIVDNEVEIENEVDLTVIDNPEVPDFEYTEEVEEEAAPDEIFTIVEDMPEFPGGEAELFRYLGKSIKYPAMAKDAGISGKVYVEFVIAKDGSVTEAKVIRGIGGGCDEEALRVVKKMPNWNPGKQRGKPVKVQFRLPIQFTLH